MLRSAAVRRRNAEYAETFAQFAVADTPASSALPKLERMGLPDGSPITAQVKKEQGQLPADTVAVTSYHKTAGGILPEMAVLRQKNADLCGWIAIQGVLELPVVYRDNVFYLDHDFEKQQSAAGALFLDEKHPVAAQTQNLLVYGHNMRDGTMFGLLTRYMQRDYLSQHPFISFSTLWEKEEYVIFAVLRVAMDAGSRDYVNYFTHPRFATDEEFDSYIQTLKAHSLHRLYLSVKPVDGLLTLSTCVGDERLVLVARRVRATETKSQLLEIIRN